MRNNVETPCLQTIQAELVNCRRCPRLVAWREETAQTKRRAFRNEAYWGKPVPGFGDPAARVLVVGLAPGAHGSNRTGRMFTGDASGDFLYPALYRAGFASQPMALNRFDDLCLKDLYITAVCRCAPPANKPTPAELLACRPWLEQEMEALVNLRGIVVLGRIALDGLLATQRFAHVPKSQVAFGHGVLTRLDGDLPWILCSYHPSRQNTQTGRLTAAMFDSIWQQARALVADIM
ncbi:MAG: uracil-DNA glycosylase [Anaerolineaceae bacterium]|jgi:uracil-DNA glycosylase family 4|nr:uracil-DNA glycosylase [Anaerolineaceae bacterium]HNX45415.1 uracil-DNA glycosylase [Anaerolineaceae bacterium]HPT24315.1 uracil-DNA glycosylase [Anaerolineaceae bacterium]